VYSPNQAKSWVFHKRGSSLNEIFINFSKKNPNGTILAIWQPCFAPKTGIFDLIYFIFLATHGNSNV
jgi:hypothetical protein